MATTMTHNGGTWSTAGSCTYWFSPQIEDFNISDVYVWDNEEQRYRKKHIEEKQKDHKLIIDENDLATDSVTITSEPSCTYPGYNEWYLFDGYNPLSDSDEPFFMHPPIIPWRIIRRRKLGFKGWVKALVRTMFTGRPW